MSAAGFRRAVITYAMELAGCTFAAAATHYIYALHMAIKANPDSVEGLYYKEGDPLSTYVLY